MDYFLMAVAILIILFSFVSGYVVGHSDGSIEAFADWCDDAAEVLLEKKNPNNKHKTEE